VVPAFQHVTVRKWQEYLEREKKAAAPRPEPAVAEVA